MSRPLPTFAALLIVGAIGCGRSADEVPDAVAAPDATDRAGAGEVPAEAPTEPLRLVSLNAREIPEETAVRPVVRLHVYDQAESWFGNAELYLTVQSSRFPPNSLVVLPINVGPFAAVEDRFVELPFAVAPGDTLTFNLLDDDSMGEEGEARLAEACRATGYAAVVAGAIWTVNPAVLKAAGPAGAAGDLIGRAIGMNWDQDHFDNYGSALYTVPERMPTADGLANQVNLVAGRRGYSVGGSTAPQTPAYLKIYARP